MDTIFTDIRDETLPTQSNPLDQWIRHNAVVIQRLMIMPHGNVLQVKASAMTETNDQSHVRISKKGITHQLTGEAFRTIEQLEQLLGVNASPPNA